MWFIFTDLAICLHIKFLLSNRVEERWEIKYRGINKALNLYPLLLRSNWVSWWDWDNSAKVSFNSHLHKLFCTPFGRQITQLAGQISQGFSESSALIWDTCLRSELFWFGRFSDSSEWYSQVLTFPPHPNCPAANISYIILPIKAVCSYRIQRVVHRLNPTPRSIVAQGKSHLFIVWERWEEVEGLSVFSSWRITAGPWDISKMTPDMWLVDS